MSLSLYKNNRIKKNELTESEKRRKEDIIRIQELLREGYQPVYIRQLTGHTYRTIRKYRDGDPDVLCRSAFTGKKSCSRLDQYADTIILYLSEGKILKDIYQVIVSQGYKGKLSYFYDYCKKLIKENEIEHYTGKNVIGVAKNKTKLNVQCFNKNEVFDYLWLNKTLEMADKERIFKKYPILHEIHACIKEFREIFKEKSIIYLHLFIEKYKNSTIKNLTSFSNGLLKDVDAVENAVSSPLSNGFLEGGNSRLKMIKRMMYGRAKLPLLRAKILL